ncbi:hypothetical protein XELAEV_18002392mg [Xenopus laevis]|uniref:Uncharacterized protein n=1 Tax=Xenopus laevis TaxID=8355 RepID=A0A974BP57_XENLA|nr:hypothetical protein XELAEV_18002392mg [Xenopus laevis]
MLAGGRGEPGILLSVASAWPFQDFLSGAALSYWCTGGESRGYCFLQPTLCPLKIFRRGVRAQSGYVAEKTHMMTSACAPPRLQPAALHTLLV